MHDEPAPGDLAILERFVNTADLDSGDEQLADPGALARWLTDAGLAPAGTVFDEAERERVVAFREAMRRLLLANHDGDADPEAIAALDGAARQARLVVAFAPDGTARLAPAEGGADGVLAALLGIVARAQAEGTWVRMKACPADTCQWAFYEIGRAHV